VPDLANTAQVVTRCLRNGLRGEVWFAVEAIPPCLLPGYEKHCLDLRQLEVTGTDIGSGAPGGRVEDYRQLMREDKRRGPQCERCSLVSICAGVWVEYAEARGTAELAAVAGLEPDYLLEDA